ncbi:MAG: Zn-dependent carboxypeptidase [Thermoleophilia bacterium]|nr:Zn-dependent carboxypeptidase [Thermoleophilia bacterium]
MNPTDTAPTHASWLNDEAATDAHRGLREYVGDYRDLASAMSLLGWDQQTKLPSNGAAGRGRAMGALSMVLHERGTSARLDELVSALEEVDPDSPEARVWRRSYNQYTKLPAEHVRASSEAAAAGFGAWQKARANDDFAGFLPYLERLVDLARADADFYGYETEPYDALHDLYEEGSRAADLEPMFAALREPINRLLDEQPEADTSVLERHWDVAGQERFGVAVVSQLGFDFESGRIDETAHPFCSTIGTFDTRLTTRYEPNWLPSSLFGTVHEAGHGIYEQAFDRLQLPRTLATAPGLGMHESQSRGYENVIGRSHEFWEYWYPHLQREFPEATSGVDLDGFVRQVNTAKRSLIRVEADELSYNLHLAVRFELERALINGTLAAKDLPEAWNTTFETWFGIRPTSDVDGVLQDVHWSGGSFGYFPTYTLGNVYAAQFIHQAKSDLGGDDAWDELLRSGTYLPIRDWLDTNIYRHGAAFTGREFVQRVTGGPVDTAPLIAYLEARFGR